MLKPGDGSSGRDVLLGRDTGGEQWSQALDRAVADGSFLLQEFVSCDPLPMDFVNITTGEVVSQGVPCCFGPYLLGGEQCGSYLRMGFPGGGSVMNVGLGALVNGLAILGE